MSKIYIQKPAEIPGAMILEGMKEVEEQVTTQDEFDNWLEELMDKYGTIYSNLQRITEEGCPMFTPDSSLGYNAKVINNLEYEKHNWNFKVFVANHSYGN